MLYNGIMKKTVLNYRVIITPETYEDGSVVYNAYCPLLDIADYGDSVEEVLNSIRDGIDLHLKTLSRERKDIPVENTAEQIITTANVQFLL